MAHFAKIGLDNVVTAVVVVANKETMTPEGVEDETVGRDFLREITGHQTWVQCSYNGNIRKNFPSKGWTYDSDRDAFIAPKPGPDWVLDEDACRWVEAE